jgi:hypothetical protein
MRKEQDKARLAEKEVKLQGKLQQDHETWDVLASKGAERVTAVANEWLETPMGKQYVKELARDMLTTDDDELNLRLRGPAGDTINVKNSDYQLLCETKSTVLAGKLFYFNSKTLERYYIENMTLPEFMLIVKANYVATQVNKVLLKVELLELEHHESEHEHAAARKVQAAYRSLKGRRMLRRLLRRDWKKRVDPQSGELFYYNVRTGQSKWEKPYLLGPGDDLAEPPYHCVLQPRPNAIIYFNRATGVSTVDKPMGMQVCSQCQTFYATTRCLWDPQEGDSMYGKNVECRGRPFCDDCFKSYHATKPALETHPSKPVAVRPAVCKVCNDPGNVVCFDCVGDVFCERCSKLTHLALSAQNIQHDDWSYIDWPDD